MNRHLACGAAVAWAVLSGTQTFASGEPSFETGAREIIATKAKRDSLGLKWFMDGNLGVIKEGEKYILYGANGSQPVRVTGTVQDHFQKVEPVTISAQDKSFSYLSGGPLFRDPESGRIFLFYHAEIHRGSAVNFYSVLGLAIQTDKDGLTFQDIGPVFVPNAPNDQAKQAIEVCGAPYVIKDGYFYVYSRDALLDSEPQQSNLSVTRAKVKDVVESALKGRPAVWQKYYQGDFSEPAIGGKSTPLEDGNPETRWIDVTYNTAINRFIMIAAANTAPSNVSLFISCSNDGIHWTKRKQLIDEPGESFYASIIEMEDDPRQTGKEFYIYYTSSAKGEWERWSDAVIVRRKITVGNAQQTNPPCLSLPSNFSIRR